MGKIQRNCQSWHENSNNVNKDASSLGKKLHPYNLRTFNIISNDYERPFLYSVPEWMNPCLLTLTHMLIK